jgi:two-component sensor histidine kinase
MGSAASLQGEFRPLIASAAAPPPNRQALRLALCAAIVFLGCGVIVGWATGNEMVKSVVPGLSTMKVNTAIGFIFVGAGLALCGSSRLGNGVAAALGLATIALGAATLSEYVTGADLGIDEAFFRDTGTLRGSGHPGRMSVLTTFAWSALGTSIVLLALGTGRRAIIAAHVVAMLAGVVALLAATGYAFGAEAFQELGQYTFIAVHTAAGLLIASAAALMVRAYEGWLEPYVDSPAALSMLRQTLPVVLLIPVGLGLLVMLGSGLGLYNAPFGLALFIVASSMILVLATLWVAGRQRDDELGRLRYERHLQVMVAELNHRVKNTLSIVQSFAHQSFRDGHSQEDARLAFEGRLVALATAHNLLTRENWGGVSLADLVGSSVGAHDDNGKRFRIDGPDLKVSPKTSITLVITLHELATNSTKYGALSAPDGFVTVGWTVDDGAFRLQWKDCNGPKCEEPLRRGFGTRMLERALASELGGTALHHFEPDGYRYEVRAAIRAEL